MVRMMFRWCCAESFAIRLNTGRCQRLTSLRTIRYVSACARDHSTKKVTLVASLATVHEMKVTHLTSQSYTLDFAPDVAPCESLWVYALLALPLPGQLWQTWRYPSGLSFRQWLMHYTNRSSELLELKILHIIGHIFQSHVTQLNSMDPNLFCPCILYIVCLT